MTRRLNGFTCSAIVGEGPMCPCWQRKLFGLGSRQQSVACEFFGLGEVSKAPEVQLFQDRSWNPKEGKIFERGLVVKPILTLPLTIGDSCCSRRCPIIATVNRVKYIARPPRFGAPGRKSSWGLVLLLRAAIVEAGWIYIADLVKLELHWLIGCSPGVFFGTDWPANFQFNTNWPEDTCHIYGVHTSYITLHSNLRYISFKCFWGWNSTIGWNNNFPLLLTSMTLKRPTICRALAHGEQRQRQRLIPTVCAC